MSNTTHYTGINLQHIPPVASSALIAAYSSSTWLWSVAGIAPHSTRHGIGGTVKKKTLVTTVRFIAASHGRQLKSDKGLTVLLLYYQRRIQRRKKHICARYFSVRQASPHDPAWAFSKCSRKSPSCLCSCHMVARLSSSMQRLSNNMLWHCHVGAGDKESIHQDKQANNKSILHCKHEKKIT